MNTYCEPDHVKFVKSNRMQFADILYDHQFILDVFHAKYDLPDRETRNLEAKENKLEALLDLVQKKGKSACKVFISLLRENLEVKKTFPRLTEIDFNPLDPASPSPPLSPQIPNSAKRAGPSRGSGARGLPTQGSTRKGQISLQGYLQQVSELIQNKKCQFFRTNMRIKDQTLVVMVFNTGLRQEFINMEKNKSLVVLERLKRGWSDSVLFTDSSRFKVLDDRLFTGNPHFGVPLATSDEMLPNKKNYGQRKSTKTSTPFPPYDPQPPLRTVTMEILGVRLKEKFSCPRDHLLEDLPPSQYVDCGLCDMKYGKAALKRVLNGKVFVRESDQFLELTDDHVRNLLKEAMDEGCDTIDKLEIALKEVCFLKVTLSNNIVISVSRASPDASQCRATHIVC
ncbi:uncharacterized protein LOC115537072 isoform X2 [Gadus morhua]|uniref:uncharacterized protein LOC115537072 isoform X2 n=1 Tax=Gadus morhua TaxID=8049 RepID=UPI0011B7BE8F|nr:uncharacterized protein LOC115537072 isoform X2 [Gadus morhua]